jgi:energy-coupling factor transport system permease protein
MDARGYGRTSVASSGARRTTGALMLAALCALCAGSYVVLRPSAPRSLAPSLIVLGLVLAAAGLWSAGRRADRTTYRADPWGWPETGVAASGLAAAAACWWVEEQTPLLAYPAVPGVPQVAALALVGVLVGLAAAVCAPPPRVVAA